MKNRKRKSIKADGTNPKGGELIKSFMPSIKEEEFKRMVDGLLANPACPEITKHEAKRVILNYIEKEKTYLPSQCPQKPICERYGSR